jgi:16S rRNA (guanine(1405)-N(7))-methyltransferase
MTPADEAALAQVIEHARRGKYEDVCPALVRRIAARELSIRGRPKDAIKTTRRKLHQVGAAYWPGTVPSETRYVKWLESLRRPAASVPASVREVCSGIMASHTSTSERLPLLDTFYQRALGPIAPVSSVLDLGCGLNPLAAPWMPLAPSATYHAYDVYAGLMRFLGQALPHLGLEAHVGCEDVLAEPPDARADVALLLKVLPLVEQLWTDPAKFLARIKSPHMLVSFPIASLGGRQRGMRDHYAQGFETMADARGWTWEAHLFETELAYLVHKR